MGKRNWSAKFRFGKWLYHNKVNSSLALSRRPDHPARDCLTVACISEKEPARVGSTAKDLRPLTPEIRKRTMSSYVTLLPNFSNHAIKKMIVIPPNSNTFPDWRRTCHVPLVKTQWRPRETTPWTLDSHVIKLCTLKPREICLPVGLMLKSHWSGTTFLIRDGIHYSRQDDPWS